MVDVPETPPVLALKNITRRFPGVVALEDVSVAFHPGEVVVLLGENGAGKSTLIKIMSGVQPPSEGELFLGENAVSFSSPRQAQSGGVRTVHQELNLVPSLPVYENVCLEERSSVPWKNHRAMKRTARERLERLGVHIDVNQLVEGLPRSTQQLVEIAKGLSEDAKLLILDEPTASLGDEEANQLMSIVRRLADEGLAVVWITHRLHEIPIVGDRVVVLRDGRQIGDPLSPHIGREKLVETMTGREPGELFPSREITAGDTVLRARGISNNDLQDVDLEVRRGEIVGVAGLLGSGKSSLARALFGLEPVDRGRFELAGQTLGTMTPSKALRRGIVYYPSDRRHEGLALGRPMYENLTMGALTAAGLLNAGMISTAREKKTASLYADRMQLRPRNPRTNAGLFSGGNQQKILLSRGLLREALIHVFDEPTVGIDVGARAEIYGLMTELAAQGKAVIVVSSDVQELIGLCDRIGVMAEGRMVAELPGGNLTDQDIVAHFFAPKEEEITA